MNNGAYSLSPFVWGIFGHSTQEVTTCHDGWDAYSELDAHVKSGDYFIQLATVLDALQNVQALHPEQDLSHVLDKIVRDLFYLQVHYEIRKK